MLTWNATKSEYRLMAAVAKRAVRELQIDREYSDIEMDIAACHCNGCALQLAELLEADRLDFAHDIFGIVKHLNRETGKLQDCFLPRFAGRAIDD